jgi:hypothetical protein
MTNYFDFDKNGIKALKVGEDKDWSSNLKKALQIINTEYVLLWLDDVFLSEKVDYSQLNDIMNFIECYNPNFLRLRPSPKPDIWVKKKLWRNFTSFTVL